MARSAHLVNLDGVTKSFGTTTVLGGVSLGVDTGDRVGVVGRNGGGKSTLLALLAGGLAPDSGRVTHTAGVTVGLLSQSDRLDPAASVLQAVVGTGSREHEWAGNARIRGVLEGLLADIDRHAVVGQLSGGERRRVALAALLVVDPALLCLDEPTNHLDVEGVAWLADHLRRRRGAVVLVTHDRWFLDEVTELTWEVVGGAVHRYEGGYAAYVLARAERERQAAASEARRQNLLRKELAWLRRGPPARTSKPRFRIDAANALIADVPPPRDTVTLQRAAAARLGRDVVDLEDVTVRMGDRVLLRDVTWRLGPAERVGLLGANGAGKSTLLRLVTGAHRPDAGRVKIGRTVVFAELAQELPADLDQGASDDQGDRVLEAVERVASWTELAGGRRLTSSQLVERLGFPAARQWTPVADLSGGERRRLQLLRVLLTGPNLLLLDEPTNDLDIDTLTEVEDLLDGFGGTLIVVSHDRWFLERTCDQLWALLGDGSLRHLPGGVDEYLTLRAGRAGSPTPAPPSAQPATNRGGDSRRGRRELTRIERRLDRLAAERETLLHRLAEHATDHERLLGLTQELRALDAERDALETEWLSLAEAEPPA